MGDKFNNHTFYVVDNRSNKKADKGAYLQAFQLALEDASKVLGTRIQSNFYVNIPEVYNKETRQTEYKGHAYVWVSNPQLYNVIAKLNPDGSPRQRVVKRSIENAFSEDIKWGDVEEEVEAIFEKEDPLITFSANFDPQPAFAPEIGDKVVSYVLFSTKMPTKMNNIQEADIKQEMVKYATSTKPIARKGTNGQKRPDSYPVVILTKKEVFVIWDPSTSDGMFATLMCKKLFLPTKNRYEAFFFAHLPSSRLDELYKRFM